MQSTEIVNIEERARTAITLGESHFREFKSALHGRPDKKVPRGHHAVCHDIGEALVAFANADGGELLVGVEDDGQITGIECLGADKTDTLQNSYKTHVHPKTPLPPIRAVRVHLEGHLVMYFAVHKSTSHIHLTADGRCIQRRDLETVPIPPEEILFSRQERESREFDREYIDGAAVSDLEYNLVRTVANHLSPGMSIEKCLQYLDLAEYFEYGLRIRRAALLLFAKEPNRWHPRLQVRILKIDGTEIRTGAHYNVKSDLTVTGNVLELLEKAWDCLRPQLVQTRLGIDARFGTTVMYPELACREAVVNSIAHRDYADEGRGIEIFVFDDRMEIRNPGALLSSIKMDDLVRLEGVHQSRNAIVARVLRELGYMRELGEGLRRMFELMHQNELTPPELKSDTNSFSVILRHKTIYTPQQKLWLEQFDQFDLDREQKAIIVLGINGKLIAPQDIWDDLGIVDTEHYRQLVMSLQIAGILKSEFPKAKAQGIARQRRLSVRKVPRFRISPPNASEPSRGTRDTANQLELITEGTLPDPQARLWVANLPYSADEASLVEFLAPYAQVENVYIPRDRSSAKPKGYAFIEFSTPEVAARVLPQISGKAFGGRSLIVRIATPRPQIQSR